MIKDLIKGPQEKTSPPQKNKITTWLGILDKNPAIRILLFLSFFAIYIALALNSVESGREFYTQGLLAFCTGQFVTLLVIYTSLKKRNAYSNKRIFLIWGATLAQLLIIQIMAHYFMKNLDSGSQFLLLVLPYILAPMITTVLLGRQMGIFTTFVVSFFSVALVPSDMSLAALTISLIAGSTAVVTTFRTRSRSQLLRAGCYCGLVVLIMGGLYGYVKTPHIQQSFDWLRLLKECIAAFSPSLLLAIILSGIFPVLESLFSITTLTGWLERSDLNEKLLRRLQIEAPGTFHHSLMVAQLAEAAAEEIGANALECRVCSYYHDIGKLSRPEYFTENMPDKTRSPHDSLTPLMSAKILMKHVDDGVELAHKYNLERHIVATIQEHHGTSMVSFLYQKALIIRDEMMVKVEKGLANPEDVVYPEESQFRYAGPIPQSKETGIVSLADAVESASRSLIHPTEDDIVELVERIVRYRINEGQLNDSRLTLGELNTIKAVFVSAIKNMLHSRISYPKEATSGEKDAEATTQKTPTPAESKETPPSDSEKKEDTPSPEEKTPDHKNTDTEPK